jgi:transposase
VEYGAIDLHKKESQVRIRTATGDVVDGRIATTRERFTTWFGERAPMQILIEASTESEWVAQHLEQLGHAVIVADPNYLPMYGMRDRRVKTDRRDVAALLTACEQGIYRRAHRRSAAEQTMQQRLHVRACLTRTRTRAIALARAITRSDGWRIPSGSAETFVRRLRTLSLSSTMAAVLSPVQHVIETADDELARIDADLCGRAAADPRVQRLMTMPSIGPVTAVAFIAALDDVARFDRPGQVTSYLGLVPREYSSGDRQCRGRTLRSAQPHVQSLLVQAAWRLMRSRDPGTDDLRAWAIRVMRRRGKKVAAVALARRLARILFAMWRDETPYTSPARSAPAARAARGVAATV